MFGFEIWILKNKDKIRFFINCWITLLDCMLGETIKCSLESYRLEDIEKHKKNGSQHEKDG
jgi:hypothetical protein